MKELRDTTGLVIKGHEGWLEFRSGHGHPGSPVEVLFKWGHNMKVDGLCRKEILKSYLVDPKGKKSELPIGEREDSAYKVAFTPEQTGFYRPFVVAEGYSTVTVDGQYLSVPKKDCEFPLESMAYTQYASAVVPVGHDLEGEVRSTGASLELLPLFWKQWRAGDTLELQVEYQGEPAAGAQVALIYGFAEENESPRVKDADDQGKVAFEFEKPGYYLAMVKRRDGDDHREGYYDCRYYTATLFMMVTK
ncbi:MAG: hypothetical protein PWP44_1257 [Thermacetogenium sp.]|nr:hypothetical protein [Thermacetogenium sp.]